MDYLGVDYKLQIFANAPELGLNPPHQEILDCSGLHWIAFASVVAVVEGFAGSKDCFGLLEIVVRNFARMEFDSWSLDPIEVVVVASTILHLLESFGLD